MSSETMSIEGVTTPKINHLLPHHYLNFHFLFRRSVAIADTTTGPDYLLLFGRQDVMKSI